MAARADETRPPADEPRPVGDEPAGEGEAGLVLAPPRGRLRAALRCPYCHDAVGRRGTVICERDGCGALYHRECWAECDAWEGCAALGCGSRVAREMSAVAYAVRLLRLGLAALVLPRRVVRALRAADAPGGASLHRQALERARLFLPTRGRTPKESLWKLVYFANTLPLGALGLLLLMDRYLIPVESIPRGIPFVPALPLIVAVLTWLALPFAVVFAAAAALHAWRAVAHAFRAELATLERGEAIARAPRPPRKVAGDPKA